MSERMRGHRSLISKLLKHHTEEEICGKSLAGAREREDITVEELSNLTQIGERTIRRMESGEISIDINDAEMFGKTLNANPRAFLI